MTVIFEGQEMIGGVTSFLVKLKVQLLILPLPSVAVKVTICVPEPDKAVPAAGDWVTKMEPDGVQLSDTIAIEIKLGIVAAQLALRLILWVAGQVITGATLSIETVTNVDSCLKQPVEVFVASTLNVVAVVRLPVGKFIVPPVPTTAVPTAALPALFLS